MDTDFDVTREERAHEYRTLLEVSESIAAHRDLPDLFHEIAQSLHRVVRFAYMRLILYDAERNVMRVHLLEAAKPSADALACEDLPVEDSPGGWVWQTQRPLVVSNLENETRFPRVTALLRQQGMRSFCAVPLTSAQRRLGALGFGSRDESAYDETDLDFLHHVAAQVAVAVDNALNYQS
ncbi:MAG: GAF domain-containing protein, partial [Gammaproteobacteria bacterium]